MKSHNLSTNKNTIKLTVCAVMVAMSTVLSLITPFHLPYGGSVTLFSFVPILFTGYAYGLKWGISSGIVYGILQTVLGISAAVAGAGFKWWQVLLCALLDYIVAGAMLGTAGMLKKAGRSHRFSFTLGTVIACLLKYFCHFLSGFILFGGWAEWFFSEGGGAAYGSAILQTFSGKGLAAIYSLIYNGLFSIPEAILSVIAVSIIISVKPVKKICEQEKGF